MHGAALAHKSADKGSGQLGYKSLKMSRAVGVRALREPALHECFATPDSWDFWTAVGMEAFRNVMVQ